MPVLRPARGDGGVLLRVDPREHAAPGLADRCGRAGHRWPPRPLPRAAAPGPTTTRRATRPLPGLMPGRGRHPAGQRVGRASTCRSSSSRSSCSSSWRACSSRRPCGSAARPRTPSSPPRPTATTCWRSSGRPSRSLVVMVLFVGSFVRATEGRGQVRRPGRHGGRHRLPVAVDVRVPGPGPELHRRRQGRARRWSCRWTRPVRIRLHATDVIHSFYVPAFFYKKDVIPGRDQRVRGHHREGRHLRRPVRRVLRPLPRGHVLHGPCRRAAPSTTRGSAMTRGEGHAHAGAAPEPGETQPPVGRGRQGPRPPRRPRSRSTWTIAPRPAPRSPSSTPTTPGIRTTSPSTRARTPTAPRIGGTADVKAGSGRRPDADVRRARRAGRATTSTAASTPSR